MQAAARPVPADVWIGLRLFRDDGMCGSWLGGDGWTWWIGNFQRSASKPNDDVGPPISDWSAVSPQGEPLERLQRWRLSFLDQTPRSQHRDCGCKEVGCWIDRRDRSGCDDQGAWCYRPRSQPLADGTFEVQTLTRQDILGAHLVRCFTAPRSLSSAPYSVPPGTIAHTG